MAATSSLPGRACRHPPCKLQLTHWHSQHASTSAIPGFPCNVHSLLHGGCATVGAVHCSLPIPGSHIQLRGDTGGAAHRLKRGRHPTEVLRQRLQQLADRSRHGPTAGQGCIGCIEQGAQAGRRRRRWQQQRGSGKTGHDGVGPAAAVQHMQICVGCCRTCGTETAREVLIAWKHSQARGRARVHKSVSGRN